MNQFDFYFIEIYSKRKTSLKKFMTEFKLNCTISSHADGYKTYGTHSYKQHIYKIFVASVQATEIDAKNKIEAIADKYRSFADCRVRVAYHISD